MVAGKEQVINGILAAMQAALNTIQLQMLESAVRESLSGYLLTEECTALSTSMDDNDYILRLFAANKKLEGCAAKSIEQYIRTNHNFLAAVNKNYKDITKDDVKMYLAVYGRGKKRNTIANCKRYLGTFYTWLHDEGYIAQNPVKTIKGIKQELVETVCFSPEEEIAIRDTASGHGLKEIALIDLLFSTGLRVGEVVALDRQSIDFRDSSITLRSEKSGRYRTVYLDVRARRHLEEYLQSRVDTAEALFVTEREYTDDSGARYVKRMAAAGIENITKRICKEAGVSKPGTVHVFRRTFATRLADRGCPLETIQELLGHADAGTTSKHYIAANKQRLKRETERYLLAA